VKALMRRRVVLTLIEPKSYGAGGSVPRRVLRGARARRATCVPKASRRARGARACCARTGRARHASRPAEEAGAPPWPLPRCCSGPGPPGGHRDAAGSVTVGCTVAVMRPGLARPAPPGPVRPEPEWWRAAPLARVSVGGPTRMVRTRRAALASAAARASRTCRLLARRAACGAGGFSRLLRPS
jgi:hypothetical protein